MIAFLYYAIENHTIILCTAWHHAVHVVERKQHTLLCNRVYGISMYNVQWRNFTQVI